MKSYPTLVIMYNLVKCLLVFYIVYFVVASVCYGVFNIKEQFNGKMPFEFHDFIDIQDCCISYSRKQIANLVAMETTFFLTTWIYVVALPFRLWDFAISVTLFHAVISSLVMVALPSNWNWWICLVVGLGMMISIGEMARYCWRKAKEENQTNRLGTSAPND